jgi:hypothetical protein
MVVLTAVFMCMQVIVDIVVIVKQEMVRNANHPSFVVIHKNTQCSCSSSWSSSTW